MRLLCVKEDGAREKEGEEKDGVDKEEEDNTASWSADDVSCG